MSLITVMPLAGNILMVAAESLLHRAQCGSDLKDQILQK